MKPRLIFKHSPYIFLLALITLISSGCMNFDEGTKPYEPLPQWEKDYYNQATKTIFPDDVRKNPEKYRKTLVAWTGIISDVKYKNIKSYQIAVFTVQHHYFDWIQDYGEQEAKFFLSPKGEGKFALVYVGDLKAESKEFISQFNAGDMLIAYGYPSEIKNNVIALSPVKNIRSVDPQFFRTDIVEYGRPGEPVRILRNIVF